MNSRKKIRPINYFKKRKVKRFSLFVIIAFVFLIFSKLSQNYKQYLNLSIKIEHLDDEIVLRNDSTAVITALVTAKGFELLPYLFNSNATIVLDAKDDVYSKDMNYVFDVNKHRYLIEEQIGAPYKIVSLKPDTLTMPFAKRAFKYVPIELDTKVDFALGYDIKKDYQISIDSVKIVGDKLSVDKIKAIQTLALNLSNVKHDISEELYLKEEVGVAIYPNSITVKAEVARFTEGQIQIPIRIINKPKAIAINYFPKEVSLNYYVQLEHYNAIKADDFKVECDYASLVEGQDYLRPVITRYPHFVKRVTTRQNRVDFIKL